MIAHLEIPEREAHDPGSQAMAEWYRAPRRALAVLRPARSRGMPAAISTAGRPASSRSLSYQETGGTDLRFLSPLPGASVLIGKAGSPASPDKRPCKVTRVGYSGRCMTA
jgi:hypothetical protein